MHAGIERGEVRLKLVDRNERLDRLEVCEEVGHTSGLSGNFSKPWCATAGRMRYSHLQRRESRIQALRDLCAYAFWFSARGATKAVPVICAGKARKIGSRDGTGSEIAAPAPHTGRICISAGCSARLEASLGCGTVSYSAIRVARSHIASLANRFPKPTCGCGRVSTEICDILALTWYLYGSLTEGVVEKPVVAVYEAMARRACRGQVSKNSRRRATATSTSRTRTLLVFSVAMRRSDNMGGDLQL